VYGTRPSLLQGPLLAPGYIVKSRRHEPLPPGWWRTRQRIFKRDGGRCVHIRYDTGTRCPEKATHCDHIIPGGGEHDGNLQSLCEYHHNIKSSSEGGRRVHARKQANKFKGHPGFTS